MVPSTKGEDLVPNGWWQAQEDLDLMVGAEHRRETWNLMDDSEHKKTWYLMDGVEHTRRLGT